MSKKIEFGGKVHEFPDDFTDAEIAAALETQPRTIAPSLLESRQAASKSEFDAINRNSTPLTRAREAAIGALEPFNLGNVAEGAQQVGGAFLDMIRGRGTARGQQLVKGAITAPVQPVRNIVEGVRTGDYDKAAYGAGGFATQTGPAVYGAAKTAGRLSEIIKKGQKPVSPTTLVEERIAPTTKETRLSTERIAPELAKNPKLTSAKNAAEFDANLYSEFQRAEKTVGAVEKTIPRTTTVPQAPIVDQIATLIEKYADMGADDAVRALQREWDKWASMPADIPWDDFIASKRRFGQQVRVSGVFRETGTAAEKMTGQALREANHVIINSSNDVSPALGAANREYSILHSAMDDAQLSYKSGRRVPSIGKHAPTLYERLKPYLLKGALGAAGYAGYKTLQD